MTSATDAVIAMLTNIKTNGWNPKSGQLFINWRVGTHPLLTDFQTSGKTDAQTGAPMRQDGHTTMRYLEAMYLLRHLHDDSSWDAEIARAESAVKSWFGPKPSNPRGWVYFDLLDMATYSGESYWNTVASALLTNWKSFGPPVKSGVGMVGDQTRTDWQIEVGAAQVHAGDASGKTRIDQAFSLNANSHGIPWDDGEVKSGEVGQEIEALAAINDPRSTQLLSAMDYLVMPSGGYFAKDNAQTGIQTTKTEPGRSAEMLRAAVMCNDATRTAKLLAVVLNHVYVSELQGVVYECNPDWTLMTAASGGLQDWVTTEAMGIAMGALLRYSIAQAGTTPTPSPVPTPSPTPNPAPSSAPTLAEAQAAATLLITYLNAQQGG